MQKTFLMNSFRNIFEEASKAYQSEFENKVKELKASVRATFQAAAALLTGRPKPIRPSVGSKPTPMQVDKKEKDEFVQDGKPNLKK